MIKKRIIYILLLGKSFVYRHKLFNKNDLDIYKFLCEFKHILTVEKNGLYKGGFYKKSLTNCGNQYMNSYKALDSTLIQVLGVKGLSTKYVII